LIEKGSSYQFFGDVPLCICLGKAHPAKFLDEIRELMGIDPDLPKA
jgi:hypothetical protein